MSRNGISVVLFSLSGALSIGIMLATRDDIVLSEPVAKYLGLGLIGIGIIAVITAAASLRGAFSGVVEPVNSMLCTTGLYKYVRHPVYLGFALAIIGACVATRSLVGMLFSIGTFIPSCIYRAYLEELSLAREFGGEWTEYRSSTKFFVPFIW